jgi:hypothetical protein
MRKLFLFMVLSLMVSLTVWGAQNPTTTTGTMHLKGKVLDSTSLPMAATTVKVYRGNSEPKAGVEPFKEGVTDNNGDFDIEVPPGDYYVDVSAPDFNSFKQAVKATATMQPLAVTLSVKTIEMVVDVNVGQSEVGVDPNDSLTTDTITGDALLDLPDNDEDLLAYLEELAAQRGIIGGELDIRVDGFTSNSVLPNRSEIQEIRIVNTSFDAGGGGTGPRIEIVTRPGTGVWQGNLGFNFADESLNAASPLTNRKPASQTRNFNGDLRGPILPGRITSTFNFRNQESENEGSAIRAVGINGPVNEGITSLRKSRTVGMRPTLTINKIHQLTSSLNYTTSRSENSGVGGFNLPERASNQRGHNWNLQMTETANFNARLRNEARFQVQTSVNSTVPITEGMAINVQDAFNGGGATNRSNSLSRNFLFANTVRWQASNKLQLTFAGEANYRRTYNNSQNNYQGTYTFSSLHDYCVAEAYPGTNCETTRDIIEAAALAGVAPVFLNNRGDEIPITGVPTQFTITQGNPEISVSQAEFAAYVQGEWRVNPRAQVSFGARYQAQQHLNDYNNLAPTLGLSYQLNTSQTWRTVVRVGGRMNYQTYSMGSWEQLLRSQGGTYQTNYLIQNPTYPTPDLEEMIAQASTQSTTLRIRAEDYISGYSFQPSLSVDQSLPRGNRVSFNFQINRGLHQTRTRNINAPFPGTALPQEVLDLLNYRVVCLPGEDPLDCRAEQDEKRAEGRAIVNAMRPDPTLGNINMSESSGSSLTKNFSVQYRVSNKRVLWNKVTIGGNVSWNMNWAEDNNGTPVNHYDLAAEWGRSSSDQRHRVTGSLTLQVPWNLRFQFSGLGYNSGRPYTLTTGSDQNGDGSSNDRPFGVGRNTETGPSYFNTISLTVTKTIPLAAVRRPAPSNYAEPQRGGGGFGGGGGGGGGRGTGGGRQIQLSVSIRNLFNSTIRSGISGNMSSPLFGQPTGGGQGRSISLSLQTNLGQLF